MVQTLQASKLSLYDVKNKFHLHQDRNDTFFTDLLVSAPVLSEFEKQQLDRTRQQYLYLADRPLLEVTRWLPCHHCFPLQVFMIHLSIQP